MTLSQAAWRNFLGDAPSWYKQALLGFLLLNPLVVYLGGPQGSLVAGWLLLIEFIFTLVMALKCYPLLPGGLLAIQAVALGLTTPRAVYEATLSAYPTLLLLVFMVAGIYFLKELLLSLFTRLLLGVHSRVMLAFMMFLSAAVLSAFMDALSVVAVLITVGMAFYQVFHRHACGVHPEAEHDLERDEPLQEHHREDLLAFRAFLRGLIMHAVVGSALGGAMTLVGQPQNPLIAKHAGWSFVDFFLQLAPVSLPALFVGLVVCLALERLRWFGYGTALPGRVRQVLADHHAQQRSRRSPRDRALRVAQAGVAVAMMLALVFHVAEAGLIGLAVIILATALGGVTQEQRIAKAFETALPFACLLVVFFTVVAVLHGQHVFEPILAAVLRQQDKAQLAMFYLANAGLAALSDNVFVATIYITELKAALLEGAIPTERFEALAVAVSAGTNLASIATPNGQVAFLFLLASALAPLLRLSYGRMLWMALPYAVSVTATGLWALVTLS